MTSTYRKVLAGGGLLLAGVVLAGCSYRSVDPVVSGAQPVPGTGSLNRFCDQTTLIYVSIVPGDADNFEAFFLSGCAKDPRTGQYVPAIAAGPPQQESTNQQDERDEGR